MTSISSEYKLPEKNEHCVDEQQQLGERRVFKNINDSSSKPRSA